VSFTPVENLLLVSMNQWQFATGIIDTGGKFDTCINKASKNGGKICHWC
jgi:hypothetical protein